MSVRDHLMTTTTTRTSLVANMAQVNTLAHSDEALSAEQQLQEWLLKNKHILEKEDAIFIMRRDDLRSSLSNVHFPSSEDEEAMLAGFDAWAKSEDGKKIICGMRKDVTFNPNIQKNVSYYACYNDYFKNIQFGTLFKAYTSATTKEKMAKYTDTLSHECRHSYQTQNNLLDPKGLSPQQYLTQNKLFEAEAKTMGGLNAVIIKYNLYDPKNIPAFLAQESKQIEDLGPSATYALQQQLKKGLPLSEAQKVAAGNMMKQYVGKNPPTELNQWQESYDEQGLGSLQCDAKLGYVTTKGNDRAYNYLLDYYERNYGLKREDIDHTGGLANEHNRSLFQKAVQQLTEKKYLKQGDENFSSAQRCFYDFDPQTMHSEQLLKEFFWKFKDYIPDHGSTARRMLRSSNPLAHKALVEWTQNGSMKYNIQNLVPTSIQDYSILKAAGYNPLKTNDRGDMSLLRTLKLSSPREKAALAHMMLKDAVANTPDTQQMEQIATFFKNNTHWAEPLMERQNAEMELSQKLETAQTPQLARITAKKYTDKLGDQAVSQLMLDSKNKQAHVALKNMVSSNLLACDFRYCLPRTPKQYETLKEMGFDINAKTASGLDALNTLVLSQKPTEDSIKTAYAMFNDENIDTIQYYNFLSNIKKHPGWKGAFYCYHNAKETEEREENKQIHSASSLQDTISTQLGDNLFTPKFYNGR